MIELFKEKLKKYIPTILECLNESTIDGAYQTSLQRYNIMLSIESDEKKISAPTFMEYIIHADYTNNEEQLHYIKEIDGSIKLLLVDYPQFTQKLEKVAERLVKAVNANDVFDNLLDWENIAVELFIITKLWKKDIEIKDIEYELVNEKSIDLYCNHKEYGDLLCEFRSIHIDINSGMSDTQIRRRVKDKIREKVKDKTKNLDKETLPADLAFLFVIQVHNGAELSQELLSKLNSISRKDEVLPIMVCQLGRTIGDNKPHFQITQIQHLIEEN